MNSSLFVRIGWLSSLLYFSMACSGDDVEQSVAAAGQAGSSGAVCEPGLTRECVGPGACRGGQECNDSGHWNSCDCGAAGGNATTAGGASSSAGNSSAGARSTHVPTDVAGAAGLGGSAGKAGATGGIASGGLAGTSFGVASAGSAGKAIAAGGMASGGFAGIAGSRATGGVSPAAGTTGQVNHLPVITALTLSPPVVRTNDVLGVTVTVTDADADPVSYAFTWTRNGEPLGANSGELDGRTSFSKGDVLRVKVTPTDGKGIGAAVTSAPITVQNSPPSSPTIPTLNPTAIADDSAALACQSANDATDPDGDSISYGYRWALNDQTAQQTTSTLDPAATLPGQKWVCQVTATDGAEIVSSDWSSPTRIVTKVNGILRTDTLWQATKSPYYLTDLVQLGADVTLTVEPGVTVMGNGKSLQTLGGVSMVGTAEKPIRVSDLYLSDLYGTSSQRLLTLKFVQWKGGRAASNLYYSHLQLTDCVIEDQDIGLWLSNSEAAYLFERNVFRNICNLQITAATAVTLQNNVFTGSACDGRLLYLGGSQLTLRYNSFLTISATGKLIECGTADAESNYWGGLADGDVPDQIYDGNDDLTISGSVDYLPTLSAPHADTPAPDKRYFPVGAP